MSRSPFTLLNVLVAAICIYVLVGCGKISKPVAPQSLFAPSASSGGGTNWAPIGGGSSTGGGGSGGTGTDTSTGGGGMPSPIEMRFAGTAQTVNADGFSIPVYPDANVQAPDGTIYDLALTGYGIRRKTVSIVTVDVYLAASYVTTPVASMTASPTKVIDGSVSNIIMLTLVRDLTGQEITDSVNAALAANNVNANDPVFAPIFSLLGNGGSAGQQLMLLTYRKPGQSTQDLIAVTPYGTKQTSGPNPGDEIWLCWFGVPADSGLAALKPQLIQNFP